MIEGIDYSDYVLSNGISVTTTPKFVSVTDIDFFTHVSTTIMKRQIKINFGFMDDQTVQELENLISNSYITIKTNYGEKVYTNVSLTRTASYISNNTIYWDSVSISGVEA